MTRSLFVTGTDTCVGKTHITCSLLLALRARGHKTRGFKPLETGFPKGQVGDDGVAIARASGVRPGKSSWLTLGPALAPSEAARIEGTPIDILALKKVCRAQMASPGGCLIEGAGGVMVPITEGYSYLDLASSLGLSAILVAANRLGVINHTLLSVAALRAAGIPIVGVVLNEVDNGQGDLARETNPRLLQALLGDIPLARGAYLGVDPSDARKEEVGESILRRFFHSQGPDFTPA